MKKNSTFSFETLVELFRHLFMSTLGNSRYSPMSDMASESGFGTLPMTDKAHIKRTISKHQNSNSR